MVIDDQKNVLDSLDRVLRLAGHNTSLLQNPIDALKIFRQNSFDAVITDYKMPHLNGIDVLTQIMEEKPDTPVVISTGYADLDIAIDALNKGAYAFIRKPLNLEMLLNILMKIEKSIRKVKENRFMIHEMNISKSTIEAIIFSHLVDNARDILGLFQLVLDKNEVDNIGLLRKLMQTIRSVTLMQPIFNHATAFAEFHLSDFIEAIVSRINISNAISNNPIDIKLSIEHNEIDIKYALPWSIVINELISNAVKHAFTDENISHPQISINLFTSQENRLTFEIADNGRGIESAMLFEGNKNFGLRMVKLIVDKRLDGIIESSGSNGTKFIIYSGTQKVRKINHGPN